MTIRYRQHLFLCAVVLSSTAAACGSDNLAEPSSSSTTLASASPSTTPVADTTAQATGFPLVVENCGTTFTLDAAPQRVVILEAAAPALLDAAGALDRVVARVGDIPTEYYSDQVNAQIAGIEKLVSATTSTGGVEVSVETIIDLEPDLVIGYETETVTRAALGNVDIPLYVMPPFCDAPPSPSFESIVAEVRFYGKMFGTEAIADASADALQVRIDSVINNPVAKGQTAAALFVSSDGSALYAYSSLGMVHPQMVALGMTNVFAALPERVPEISIEEIINANPENLILLYTDTEVSADEIIALVTDLPGAETIKAVSNGRVFPMLFNFAEPPSPLVVDGLDLIAEQFAR